MFIIHIDKTDQHSSRLRRYHVQRFMISLSKFEKHGKNLTVFYISKNLQRFYKEKVLQEIFILKPELVMTKITQKHETKPPNKNLMKGGEQDF